jgi:uncharacterized protein (DUF1810 family)
MKIQSSMTLFAKAGSGGDVFERCLEKYFTEALDPATLARL